MAEKLPQPTIDEMSLSTIMTALAEPLRMAATVRMSYLPEGTERSCSSFGFPVAKASLTHHFRVMREAGLISQIDYGNRRASMLRISDLNARFPGLLALLRAEADHEKLDIPERSAQQEACV
ncbi:ArsR family transcriptional regulator [Enterobacter hormaechei]